MRANFPTSLSILLTSGFLLNAARIEAATLLTAQSDWRLRKGTSEASVPLQAWRLPDFDDSNWTAAPAPFHYGEGLAGGTELSDMRNAYSSVYLRHSFAVSDPARIQTLQLRARCDDGFIAWINGVEVARVNMPAGDIPFNGYASAAVAEPVAFNSYSMPVPEGLRTGTNVLAVQVFNTSLSSSDLQWEAELASVEADLEPPRIQSIAPPPGTIERLTEVIVTFTEPVAGVQASDLSLGARMATEVAGDGTRYIFRFDPADPGPVQLRWDADTLITDLASPPNRFDALAAGPWQYQLEDRTPPIVTEIVPAPLRIVRALQQIEIKFSEPIIGLNAADLLVNGVGALRVTGSEAGPYRFEFPPTSAGQVRFSWADNHDLRDTGNPANAYIGIEWTIEVDPNYAIPALRINEFLTSNLSNSGLRDEDGELQDWIEIYNDAPTPVELEGWSLTDDPDDPGRWIFPAVSIPSRGFLVVFASGKDRRPTTAGGKLHASFKLNATGEYLGLLNYESPRQAVSEFAPGFPEQRNDISFGFNDSRQLQHFQTLTPGSSNGTSLLLGVVPPPEASVARGWMDAPFELRITNTLADVTIRFTLDGSEPSASNGETYAGPMRISSSTTLRVAAFRNNMLPSVVRTFTYLFLDSVISQSNSPAGFPVGAAAWGGFPSDYEMDPEITTDPVYSARLAQALRQLPALSLVCRIEDLFGSANGIYTHPLSRGPAWERPCSVEFMSADGSPGFEVRAGVQVQGNAAREPQKQPKHPLRLVFKGDYGPRRLDFPMFPDSPVTEFDTLILRADFNFSWLHWDPQQRLRAQRTRDAWMKDSMRAMGGLATHNRYVHLFLNGLYWGVYDISERPDGAFAGSYLGGEKEEYDVINEGEAVDGTKGAYNQMLALTNLGDAASFAQIRQFLDLEQFHDYMLLHFYVAHQDWGENKNWYALRPKSGSRGFFYLPWDGEMILDNVNHNRVSSSDTPSGLHTRLLANSEYRLAFADRVQKHLFPGGALTPAAVEARWLRRAGEVELPIVAESARWGDYRRDVHSFQSGPFQLYTPDNQWRAEQQRLLTEYFPRRSSILLSQLRDAGLYPNVAPPEFSRLGGHVPRGSLLTMQAPFGSVYFTMDDTDPRLPGGAIAPAAQPFLEAVRLNESARVRARTYQNGAWSALVEQEFHVGPPGIPLRFTEIMYHPAGGDTLEFIELQNTGPISVDMGGFSLAGVGYTFPHRTILRAGQIAVIASAVSPTQFAAHYPGMTVVGHFNGSLSNGGEQLELHDREGRTVTAVAYSDQGGWPSNADGQGYSLECLDPAGDPNAPANWAASPRRDGSPGRPASQPLGPVRLNEIQARPEVGDAPGDATDWIELANRGASTVALDGWSLVDEGGGVFMFPAGTMLASDELLTVWCDGKTNAPGLHAPFQLAQEGETIGLFGAMSQRVDAVTFGRYVPGFTFGRMGPAEVWTLTRPTPGQSNLAAELAPSSALRINEWLADPPPGEDDWIELFNSDSSRPVPLAGLTLTASERSLLLQSLSFVPPNGFRRLFATGRAGGEHLGFKLPGQGGVMAVLDSDGVEVDQVVYATQTEGVSEGRYPDGAVQIVRFPGSATPAASNHLPLADADQDGMEDGWERLHGLDPSSAADAILDPDADGLSNVLEFLAGTDPLESGSRFEVKLVTSDALLPEIRFSAQPNRTYIIQYSNRLGAAEWVDLATVPPGIGVRAIAVTDPTRTQDQSTRFYRVIIPAGQALLSSQLSRLSSLGILAQRR